MWHLPPGLPTPVVPLDNPMSDAKVALGRRLFYDTRLSGNLTYACATCHRQAFGFADGLPQAIGSTGGRHARSAMSLTNVAYNASFGWADPNRRTLEAQMAVPMYNEHPIELGLAGREQEIVGRFSGHADDEAGFRQAFPDETPAVSLDHVVKAIAAFERTLVSGDSPVDRYLYRDDRQALTPEAARGMALFFSSRLKCGECHSGFNLSGATTFESQASPPDIVFHNTALYNVDGRGGYPASDRGLIDITGKARDMGRFRAPTLRNIAVTAPYMHDGSLATLDQVISHYATRGVASPFRSDRLTGFQLSASERADLLAFLESLTDRTFLTEPGFSNPFERADRATPSR